MVKVECVTALSTPMGGPLVKRKHGSRIGKMSRVTNWTVSVSYQGSCEPDMPEHFVFSATLSERRSIRRPLQRPDNSQSRPLVQNA
jgi:hypothetical protein